MRLVVFAVAELAGGHIFKVGGYATVYFVSLFICTCGLLYVMMVIPAESDTNVNRSDERSNNAEAGKSISNTAEKDEKKINPIDNNHTEKSKILRTIREIIKKGNRSIVESYRYCIISIRNKDRPSLVCIFANSFRSYIRIKYPFRCLVRTRENGERKYILSLLGISLFSGMQRGVHKNGLLFTEKVFGWNVVDYTNYRSFECTVYAIR